MPGDFRVSKRLSLKISQRKSVEEPLKGTFNYTDEEKDAGNTEVTKGASETPPKPPRLRTNGLSRLSFRSTESYDMSFKIMLIGDSGVGKTCFLIRYKDGAFLSGAYISTIGIDFRNKIMAVNGTKVKLQVWDTAGQERFRSVTQAYYRDAHAVLLIYDVGKRESFDNIQMWLNDVKRYGNAKIVFMLIGNKADMSSSREVTIQDGKKLAEEYGLLFKETSAKTGMNVDHAFKEITNSMALHQQHMLTYEQRNNINGVLVNRQEGVPKDRSFDLSQPDSEENSKRFGCC